MAEWNSIYSLFREENKINKNIESVSLSKNDRKVFDRYRSCKRLRNKTDATKSRVIMNIFVCRAECDAMSVTEANGTVETSVKLAAQRTCSH